VTAVFADSSALVKLYADEVGAELVRTLSPLVISQLARVEVPAALWRKHRIGELSAADATILISAFEADYFGTEEGPERFLTVGATAPILDAAAQLAGTHGLRAYDSVQLASACSALREAPEGMHFAAFDQSLRTAAAREGLQLLFE
jgi:predicted nucleic acid-binding protein